MVPGQTYTLYNCRSHELRMGSPSDLWYRIGFERNNSGIDPNPLLCQMQQQQLQILGSGQQLAVQIQHEPSNAPSAPPCILPPEGQIPAPQISVQVSNAHEDPPQNQVAAQATGTPVSSRFGIHPLSERGHGFQGGDVPRMQEMDRHGGGNVLENL
uniref:ZP domain-containing protein n=1 Tax=Globodera pallida TaxID=36090 RepID=A0A183CAP3_GLOPA